jgi:hypothetical protein
MPHRHYKMDKKTFAKYFQEGYHAPVRATNPYPENSKEAIAWAYGDMDAHRDACLGISYQMPYVKDYLKA